MNELAKQNQEQDKQPGGVPIKGRFARYKSSFLELMVPLLVTRYFWLAVEDINPSNFLKKPDPARPKSLEFAAWEKPGAMEYARRNFAALGMGATVLGITGFYSKRTYDDIKSMYAEAVGYELRKKPEDVGWKDIFINSHNSTLEVTRNAFLKRTGVRALAASAFLFPWHAFRDFPKDKPKYDANANAGVGAMGGYLSIDAFTRKETFFEAQQMLVDVAINHVDNHVNTTILPSHIQSLLLLQRKHMDHQYQSPAQDSPEGQNEDTLASRIASLLNQTYNNVPNTEHAHFSIGKFNYLVGFGMLDHFPASLGFVELANQSENMQKVDAVAAAIKEGQDPATAFQSAGIDLPHLAGKQTEPHSAQTPHAEFARNIQPAKDRIPGAARMHQEFAATQPMDPQLSS